MKMTEVVITNYIIYYHEIDNDTHKIKKINLPIMEGLIILWKD